MFREIRKKLVILGNRKPFREHVQSHLNELDEREWIYMNMRLSGRGLSNKQIDRILDGKCILEATVEDHLLINQMTDVREYVEKRAAKGYNVTLKAIKEIHDLVADEELEFRKSSPVLFQYSYTPMAADRIPQAMEELVAFARDEDCDVNFVEKAVQVHNRFLEIYPYREGNEYVARVLMYLILALNGVPFCPLTLSEQEYNDCIIEYLKKGSHEAMTKAVLEAILAKLELMRQLTGYNY